jgi:hypothetical protein
MVYAEEGGEALQINAQGRVAFELSREGLSSYMAFRV